jgi:hypothetical protein
MAEGMNLGGLTGHQEILEIHQAGESAAIRQHLPAARRIEFDLAFKEANPQHKLGSDPSIEREK